MNQNRLLDAREYQSAPWVTVQYIGTTMLMQLKFTVQYIGTEANVVDDMNSQKCDDEGWYHAILSEISDRKRDNTAVDQRGGCIPQTTTKG